MFKTLAITAALFAATVSAASVTYVRASNMARVDVVQVPVDEAAMAALRQRAADLHQMALGNTTGERRFALADTTEIMKVRAE